MLRGIVCGRPLSRAADAWRVEHARRGSRRHAATPAGGTGHLLRTCHEPVRRSIRSRRRAAQPGGQRPALRGGDCRPVRDAPATRVWGLLDFQQLGVVLRNGVRPLPRTGVPAAGRRPRRGAGGRGCQMLCEACGSSLGAGGVGEQQGAVVGGAQHWHGPDSLMARTSPPDSSDDDLPAGDFAGVFKAPPAPSAVASSGCCPTTATANPTACTPGVLQPKPSTRAPWNPASRATRPNAPKAARPPAP